MKQIRKSLLTALTIAIIAVVAVFSVSALSVGTVSYLKAAPTNTAVTLSWKKATNASGYRVYEYVSGSWKALKTTTATSFKAENLKTGTKHTYGVKAYGKEKGKTVWAKKFVIIKAATRPALVKTIKATQTENSISLTWNKVSGATGYRVYKYNTSTKKWETALKATSKTTATVKNLTAGKKYYFAVKPYINTGDSIVWASTYTKILTCTKPSVPSKVTAKATTKTAALSWSKVTGATGYRVYRYNSSTKKWVALATTTSRAYTVKGLTPEKSYIFAVKPYIKVDGNTVWGSYKKVSVKTFSEIKIINIELLKESYAIGVDKDQPELLYEINNVLSQFKKDGTIDKIVNNYFGDGTPVAIKSATYNSSKDQLIVATNAEYAPFEYSENGKYYGIDMELIALVAKELGKELVIKDMSFSTLCVSVDMGKCDVAIAALTAKNDRKEIVDFTIPYYNASQKIIAKSSDKTFDSCKSASQAEKILRRFDSSVKIGVQQESYGEYYVIGDEAFGLIGLDARCISYERVYDATKYLSKGILDYVIVDASVAQAIVKKINQ